MRNTTITRRTGGRDASLSLQLDLSPFGLRLGLIRLHMRSVTMNDNFRAIARQPTGKEDYESGHDDTR
jgi:hypothetical protein